MYTRLSWGLALLSLLFLVPIGSVAAQGGSAPVEGERFTLSGYIKDAGTGEELIYANVHQKDFSYGATSNIYGFYSITLPPGQHTLEFSYLGYEPLIKTVQLFSNQELNIELQPESAQLEEIVVKGEAENESIESVKMSRIDLPIAQIKKMPALFGEPDLIKTIQTLPGVASAGEGTSSFFVRGGSADQNLVLIDEAPVYELSHLFGLASIFNADIIKNAELYKGGIPPKFGGRLSSLLEVSTRDGNSKEFAGSAALGLLSAKASLEGPIVRDKASFIAAGRRSYVDLFMKLSEETKEDAVQFYDLNLKFNLKANNRNRFFLSGYRGRDIFRFGDDFQMDWGNSTATFRWNHLFNDRLFSNLSVIYSNFDYRLEDKTDVEGFVWKANQEEVSVKEDFTYFINPRITFKTGYHGIYRHFQPGLITPNSDRSIFKETKLQEQYALDHGLYAGFEHILSDRLAIQYGIRFTIFQNIGSGTIYQYADPQDNIDITVIDSTVYGNFDNIKTFSTLEPRFSARYKLSARQSIKASYQRMAQYIHLISNSTVPIPFNTWAPSSPYLDPQIADQVAIGYFQNFRDNTFEFSVEAFYKKAVDVTEFADNAAIFFNRDLATEFRQGELESYGIEFFLKKNKGKLRGFTSYTWSKAETTIPTVNRDQPFPANHDRRHNFNLALTYQLDDRWEFATNFNYSSGRPITLPTGKYEFDNYKLDLFSERNGYRLPAFHRMDVSVTFNSRKNEERKIKRTKVFGIYNVYNKKNPFTIYTRVKQDDEGNIIGDGTEKEARLVYLFGILPYASLNFTF